MAINLKTAFEDSKNFNIKISELFNTNQQIWQVLSTSQNLTEARKNMLDYLNNCEEKIMNANCVLHSLEIRTMRDCIHVFKNIISEKSEKITGYSCLNTLYKLAIIKKYPMHEITISDAFIAEMYHLFGGIIGLADIYSKAKIKGISEFYGTNAAIDRSKILNRKANQYIRFIKKNNYKTGLESLVVQMRQENKKRILNLLNATEENWGDYNWHLKMCFRTSEKVNKIIELSDDEKTCIKGMEDSAMPFYITPFYLSLMDKKQDSSMLDRSLRTHVIPNRIFLEKTYKSLTNKKRDFDFMKESDTSPIEMVTRRYPMIAIFKPFLSCPQICIYCQRNWEIEDKDLINDTAPQLTLDAAISWFEDNPEVREVLITGGDPMTMDDAEIDYILQRFSDIPHIKRIRFGTRTLVTMPMRFGDKLLSILKKYHQPPEKTISIMTHVQNAYEISPEMAKVVREIKLIGIDIFNQQVFTMQNCRKFETCFLRESLKEIGISPYYLFNLKAKDETAFFKTPIARILQEQKEEARLLPGILRTDKIVFNIPALGKNELSCWQDHDVIMVLEDGSRIYEFYPWEKNMNIAETFLYKDEPIYNFLKKLEDLHEETEDYKTIWYYF